MLPVEEARTVSRLRRVSHDRGYEFASECI
jgi:hypothetical protein